MSSRIVVLGLTAVVATACKPPEELTNLTLIETIPLFFRDFDDDPEKLPEYVDALEEGLSKDAVDLVSENLDDRAYTIVPLGTANLGGAAQPPDTLPEDQTPVVVFGSSPHDFAANMTAAMEPNQVCIESDSTVSYTRTYEAGSDVEAFKSSTADVITSTNAVRKELSFIASGWYDLFKDFRTFETTDGRKVLIARAWSDKIALADGGNNEFRQSYTLELYIEDGGDTKRMYAIWPEIKIGIGPDAMRALIRDSLDEGYKNAESFMTNAAVPDCKNDRSEVFERP